MRHQAQNCFCGFFVGIPQYQKGCLVYIPGTRKIIYSYDVVYGEIFYSTLAYTPQPFAKAMAMRMAVSYTPYATSPRKQTGDIITFPQFEERGLLSETDNSLSATHDNT